MAFSFLPVFIVATIQAGRECAAWNNINFLLLYYGRAVGRYENPGEAVVMRWA